MSQTTSSSVLSNRIVTFVNIDKLFDCAICMQVADELVRCSCMCAGIFCSKCMQQALRSSKRCPVCSKSKAKAKSDVVLRNQIMNNQVYCINKGNEENTSSTSQKRKSSSTDGKCVWIGKYDELSTHLKNECEFEMMKCPNNECNDEIERRKLEVHQQSCVHRTILCNHCNEEFKVARTASHLNQCPKVEVSCVCKYKCTRDMMDEHRDKDCLMTEIICEVIGCGRKIMRKDYVKHQDDAAKQHVRLLSATLQRVVETIDPRPSQIKWRVPDIAAKLREASASKKNYSSPTFDILFRGSHKLCIHFTIEGNKLGLYLVKQMANSDNKNPLDITGTSLTITKDGQSDTKRTFSERNANFVKPPHWKWGWPLFLADMTSYIDNDSINITLDLKLKEVNEPLVL